MPRTPRLNVLLFAVYGLATVGVLVGAFLSPGFRALAYAPLRDLIVPPPKPIVVDVLYSTEKAAWIDEGVRRFLASGPRVEGRPIEIELSKSGSREMYLAVLDGDAEPDMISPASMLQISLLQDLSTARTDRFSGPAVDRTEPETCRPVLNTPVVLVAWENRSDALWGDNPNGRLWLRLHEAVTQETWEAYGHPEWGYIKFGQTNPLKSNSGFQTFLLMTYNFAEKSSGLSNEDILDADYQAWYREFGRNVTKFGDSTGTFMEEIVAYGPSRYDIVAVYESTAIEHIDNAVARYGSSHGGLRVIYPPVTSLSDHPFCVLDAEWVEPEEAQAAKRFLDFLTDREMQELALQYGFRPVHEGVSLDQPGSPFGRYEGNGVRLAIPDQVEVPVGNVLNTLLEFWARNVQPWCGRTLEPPGIDGRLEAAGEHAPWLGLCGQATTTDRDEHQKPRSMKGNRLMRRGLSYLAVATMVSAVLLTGCGALPLPGGKRVTITMIYGSEKEAWLVPLIETFNSEGHETEAGATILVEATPMGSIASGDGIVEGTLKPTVWSPASSAYAPVTNANWLQKHGEDLVVGTPNDLVLSPVVIAMWRPMAEALGWPDESLGWADIAALATSEDGWVGYGYPEWGSFKFGHTHPDFSNSGLISVIAEAYAATGKPRGLTLTDLQDPELKAFMADVESSVIHYGESTGFFATRMFERGPSYLSAAVMYENLIAAQEAKRLRGESDQPPVVAIYPEEGTAWSNHPYIILNAPWVSDEQREAAEVFEAYLLAEPQQRLSVTYGFRPSDPGLPLNTPLDLQHGVDPTEPKTVLEVPSAEVVVGVQELWRSEVKKPVDVVVVMDTSGSMEGKKISSARSSLVDFIDLMDDRDRLQVILFSDEMITLTELSPLAEKRQEVRNRVSGVIEGGDTKLYSAVELAHRELDAYGDPDHIRAIVVLTDGQDTASPITLPELTGRIGAQSESGDATKIFTIAFGRAADREILQQIAEITGGRQYDSDPETIGEIYAEIATFF